MWAEWVGLDAHQDVVWKKNKHYHGGLLYTYFIMLCLHEAYKLVLIVRLN